MNVLIKNRCIPILFYYSYDKSTLSQFLFKPVSGLTVHYVKPPRMDLYLMWQSGWMCDSFQQTRPSWMGLMQDVHKSQNSPLLVDLCMIPIICLNPTDPNCIHLTLCFIVEQASKLNLTTPCVTFDQPLWLKAVNIVKSAKC